jgi:hypothetical protein
MGENQMKKSLLLLSLIAVTPVLKAAGEDNSFVAGGKSVVTGLYQITKGLVLNGVCTSQALTGAVVGHFFRPLDMDRLNEPARVPSIFRLFRETDKLSAIKRYAKNPTTTFKGALIGSGFALVTYACNSLSFFKPKPIDPNEILTEGRSTVLGK